MDLVVESTTQGSDVVLTVSGEIDLFTAPKLRERLTGAIDEGASRIIVDLEGVGFMDSTGLGSLVGGLKRIKERGGTMTLVCTNRAVLRILSITGLDRVFPVAETLEQAQAGEPGADGA